jgi:hypothetical protein
MTTLLVLGNINQFTFANSVIAANAKAEEIFEQSLTNIFVVHSRDSYAKLRSNEDWVDHIEANGVNRELFVDKIVEITAEEDSIKRFIDYIEFILKGIPNGTNLNR